jgi:hypothetical protein
MKITFFLMILIKLEKNLSNRIKRIIIHYFRYLYFHILQAFYLKYTEISPLYRRKVEKRLSRENFVK